MPASEVISIPLNVLTPIWTGDHERKTNYIKATSILGGLRFWTEALLRSLGEEVCRITDEGGRCLFDPERPNDICKVCSFYGCTGRGRGFRLSIQEKSMQPEAIGKIELKSREYMVRNEKTQQTRKVVPTWWLESSGFKGDMELKLSPLRPGGISSELALSLVLMLKWGTLGARDQFGYGGIKANLPQDLLVHAKAALPATDPPSVNGISLKDFFFFNAALKKSYKELPFEVRFDVRQSLRPNPDTDRALRHFFCGSIRKEDKAATKYNMVLLPGGRLQGWGYFPIDNERFGGHRDRCVNFLKSTLLGHPHVNAVSWREFDSSRDTVKQVSLWNQFLGELFIGGWS